MTAHRRSPYNNLQAMTQPIFEQTRGDLLLSTDRHRLDLDAVHAMLRATHWAREMSRPVLEKAVENSLCFAVYLDGKTIAFARLVTDHCTYAYLTDVVVAEEHRGRGIGNWLTEAIVGHPDMKEIRRISLLTSDAQWLYERHGFKTDTGKLIYMERRNV